MRGLTYRHLNKRLDGLLAIFIFNSCYLRTLSDRLCNILAHEEGKGGLVG